MFEFIRSHTRQGNRNIFKIDNQTKKILSSKDGFILMTAHLGNWEMILPVINHYKKITAVVRHHNNIGGNRFFSECRNLSNVTLISNKGSRKKMIDALNHGEVLGLASDQNAKDRGTYVDFFGRKASIPKGAGHFHYLTCKKVVIGFCILNEDLSYTVKLKEIFFEIPYSLRTTKHISDPMKGSAAKRINMFLRWMVRKDNNGVDFGIWESISPKYLSCPLDVHTGNVARKLNLITRKQNDHKTVVELDHKLRKFDKNDPVKYDFALFGLGIFEKF